MTNKKTFLNLLITLCAIFLIIVLGFFVMNFDAINSTLFSIILFGGGGLYTILGIILVVFTFKQKIKGTLKTFLLLTGFAATGFLIGAILHNLCYAAATVFLPTLFGFLEGLFFIIAIPVSPIIFVISLIGSFVLIKNLK